MMSSAAGGGRRVEVGGGAWIGWRCLPGSSPESLGAPRAHVLSSMQHAPPPSHARPLAAPTPPHAPCVGLLLSILSPLLLGHACMHACTLAGGRGGGGRRLRHAASRDSSGRSESAVCLLDPPRLNARSGRLEAGGRWIAGPRIVITRRVASLVTVAGSTAIRMKNDSSAPMTRVQRSAYRCRQKSTVEQDVRDHLEAGAPAHRCAV